MMYVLCTVYEEKTTKKKEMSHVKYKQMYHEDGSDDVDYADGHAVASFDSAGTECS